MKVPAVDLDLSRGRAIGLFNRGAWREAVDEWEVAYHAVEGPARKPWLAFIRVSAALHHLSVGHPYSARRLFRSGRALLVELPRVWGGIDVVATITALDLAFAPLGAASEGNEQGLEAIRAEGSPWIVMATPE